MSEVKVPSVGRVVHYKVSPSDPPELRSNYAEVLPAIIVIVWSDNNVNLKVFTDGPTDVWKTSVLLGDEPGQWSWPPYVPPAKTEE